MEQEDRVSVGVAFNVEGDPVVTARVSDFYPARHRCLGKAARSDRLRFKVPVLEVPLPQCDDIGMVLSEHETHLADYLLAN